MVMEHVVAVQARMVGAMQRALVNLIDTTWRQTEYPSFRYGVLRRRPTANPVLKRAHDGDRLSSVPLLGELEVHVLNTSVSCTTQAEPNSNDHARHQEPTTSIGSEYQNKFVLRT